MATDASTTDREQFETRQIKDVTSARSIYTTMKNADEKRAKTRATTRSQLEGGKPMNAAVLRKRGEGWRCNENFGDAAASRDRALLPYWLMANSARTYIGAKVHNSANDSERWGQIIEECFDLFIEDWGAGWPVQYLRIVRDLIDFGVGHPYWKDKSTARFESMPIGRVLFQDTCPIDKEKWPVVAIEKEFTVTELMKYVSSSRAESRSKFVGWQTSVIKSLIVAQAHRKMRNLNTFRWEEIQTEIISNDIFVSQDFPPIECVILLVQQNKEEDGISSWIFPKIPPKTDIPNSSDVEIKDGFVYKSKKHADAFPNVLGSIVYEVAQGTMHSVKGFAIRNFAQSAMLNKMKCKLVDSATISQSLNFKRSGDKAEDGPPIENHGAINIISANLQEITNAPKTAEGINAAEYIEKGMDQNNSAFTDQGSLIQQTDTATAAKIIATQAQDVSTSNADLYLTQLGTNVYTEMVRRLLKSSDDPDARKFKERCIERGIPKKMISKLILTITAANASGIGNPALRTLQWVETFNLLSGVTRVNQDWLIENYIADVHGSKAVDKALLPEGSTSQDWEARQAIMENDVMQNGSPIPAVQVDNHITHLKTHIGTLEAVVNSFKKTGQADNSALTLTQMLITHIEQHFGFITNDDSVAQERNRLFGIFSNLKKEAISMANQIQAQAVAEQQRQLSAQAAAEGAQQPQNPLQNPPPALPASQGQSNGAQ